MVGGEADGWPSDHLGLVADIEAGVIRHISAGYSVQAIEMISPEARTDGGTRRYSADDLVRIERILTLVATGVNIVGIGRILELEDDNAALRAAAGRVRG